MAIMAAFERVRARSSSRSTPISRIRPRKSRNCSSRSRAGHDYVGGYRLNRQDSFFRHLRLEAHNFVREKTTSIQMTDQGCMLRAYSRPVIDAIVRSGAINTFIPPSPTATRAIPARSA